MFEPLDLLDREVQTESIGDVAEIRWIAGDCYVPPSCGPNHDGGIHNVGDLGYGTRSACCPGPRLVEVFDPAAFQQSRQLSLRSAPPALSQHSSGHGWYETAL